MLKKFRGFVVTVGIVLLLCLPFAGWDYSSYQAQASLRGPTVGVEFSTEWGMTIPFHQGMTVQDAVMSAVQKQVAAGSNAEMLTRKTRDLEGIHLLRNNTWSMRRALWRMSVIGPLLGSAPVFDDARLNGPKKNWPLKIGDYVLFHNPNDH